MRLFYRVFISLLFIFINILPTLGQPDNPDGDPFIPIDGGLAWLAGAGIIYGVKKFLDNKKGA